MTGRVFVTGDKHRTFVPLFGLAEKQELRETDILIIAGDAGYVWDKDYPHDVESLEQVFPGIIAFIDGNHENHQILNSFPVSRWMGGNIHRIGARVFHLMRGEVYSIYGRNYFVFGGARSVDKDRRKEGVSWWREEEPSPEEMAYGREQLERYRDEIDFVITHETPLFARGHISRQKPIDGDYRLPEVLEEWYRRMEGAPRFKKWYFGHMHVDQKIAPNLMGLHHLILNAEDETSLRWV